MGGGTPLSGRFDGLGDFRIEKQPDRKPPGIVAPTIRGGWERRRDGTASVPSNF
jgi:hypothetical protein